MPDDNAEAPDAYVLKLLTTIADGPVGALLLDMAEGRRRIVIKQHLTGSGWVVETELVE